MFSTYKSPDLSKPMKFRGAGGGFAFSGLQPVPVYCTLIRNAAAVANGLNVALPASSAPKIAM
ncbi:hypothetical protein SedNR2807_16000 [Citrobacter sedlakii]